MYNNIFAIRIVSSVLDIPTDNSMPIGPAGQWWSLERIYATIDRCFNFACGRRTWVYAYNKLMLRTGIRLYSYSGSCLYVVTL